MIIKKVYNNNVLLVFDKLTDKELVVIGSGIGFKKSKGDIVDTLKIEKKFVTQDDSFCDRINDLSKNVSDEVFSITNKIVDYAENILNTNLDKYIYISLADHISFALKRHKEGIFLKNELLSEIKRIHKKEYEIGKWSIDYINKAMNIDFDNNEAGFIAIHIINANYKASFTESKYIIKIIDETLNIIKNYYNIEFEEDYISYERLITHLKFFIKRLIDKKEYNDYSNELLDVVKEKYKDAYDCANDIKENLYEKYKYKINEDEILYLTIHINKVVSDIKNL